MSTPGAKRTWTGEQLQAIGERGRNLLVSAAAGSGKTAVLVERVIRRVTEPPDPVDADRLLVVTFTEAASSEMRARIAEALEARIAADPDDERLERELVLLGRASICTVHAFCLDLIRRYYHLHPKGLDPGLRVMSQEEADLLRTEVLEEVFTAILEEGESPAGSRFRGLADAYGGAGTSQALKGLVLKLHGWVRSLPWPEDWLARTEAAFSIGEAAAVESLAWWEPIRATAAAKAAVARQTILRAVRIASESEAGTPFRGRLAEDLEIIQAIADAAGEGAVWEGLRSALRRAAGELDFRKRQLSKKKDVDAALRAALQALREKARKPIEDISPWFSQTSAEVLEDLRGLGSLVKALRDLVGRFSEAYQTSKIEQGVMDFHDIEHYALDLLLADPGRAGDLRASKLALSLRWRFDEVLVDEYQDVNRVQDTILSLVSRDGRKGPPNRFMVGDVKQSIYRFREAEPELFLGKLADYGAGEGGKLLLLSKNFRSREPIVDAVNFLFGRILTKQVGELDYADAAKLAWGAEYPELEESGALARGDAAVGVAGDTTGGGACGTACATFAGSPVELHLVERVIDGSDGAAAGDGNRAEDGGEDGQAEAEQDGREDARRGIAPEDLDAAEREAAVVAGRIRDLMERGPDGTPRGRVYDAEAKGYRPIAFRDIVVLLRATRGTANAFVETLRRFGLPAHADLATGYFDATEVRILLALLNVLDNPRQDIHLAAVLRSPLAGEGSGATAVDLARIRLAAPLGSFHDAVVAASRRPGGDDSLAASLRRFLDRMEEWRTAARRGALSTLVWRILTETGYLHYVGGMPSGEQRRANLLALYERARQFDHFSRQGLFRFLRFIERLQEEEGDLGTAPVEGADEDVVRIMSIHQAKGLEFPVVVVAGLGRLFNLDDLRRDLLFQRALGFGPKVVKREEGVKYPSIAHRVVAEAKRLEQLAEEMRILYVALTRAREKLVLVGGARNLPRECDRWTSIADVGEGSGKPLPDVALAAARCFLDWIGPALALHPDGAPIREAMTSGGAGGLGDGAASAQSRTPAGGQPVTGGADTGARDETAAGGSPRSGGADSSRWQVTIWDGRAQRALGWKIGERPGDTPPGLEWASLSRAEPLPPSLAPVPSDASRRTAQALQWRYPRERLGRLAAKRAATGLRGLFSVELEGDEEAVPLESLAVPAPPPRFESEPEAGAPRTSPGARASGGEPVRLDRRSRFLQESPGALSASEIGSATHLVLEKLDLAAPLDGAGVARQIEGLVEKGFLARPQADAVDAQTIAAFFDSSLGKRMLAEPGKVRREVPFTFGVPAGRFYPEAEEAEADEIVVVQGRIDVLLESEDGRGYAIVDYKTGTGARQDLSAAAARYRDQLGVYAEAMRQILGRSVIEAYLCFLDLGETVSVLG